MKTFLRLALLLALAAALPAFAATDKNYSAAVKLIKSKNYAPAKFLLESDLRSNPESVKLLSALAYIAKRQKKKQEALAYYRKILLIHKAKGGSPKTTQAARKSLVELSPATGAILQKSEELTALAKETKNKKEKALLELSAKTLQDFALGQAITVAPGEGTEPGTRKPAAGSGEGVGGSEVLKGLRLKWTKIKPGHVSECLTIGPFPTIVRDEDFFDFLRKRRLTDEYLEKRLERLKAKDGQFPGANVTNTVRYYVFYLRSDVSTKVQIGADSLFRWRSNTLKVYANYKLLEAKEGSKVAVDIPVDRNGVVIIVRQTYFGATKSAAGSSWVTCSVLGKGLKLGR